MFLTMSLERKHILSRSGGTRPLRPVTLEAESSKRIKKKYLTIVASDPTLHKRIISILNAEIEMRKNSNSLPYMHAMDVWLNQRDWEKYEYLLNDNEDVENEKTERI